MRVCSLLGLVRIFSSLVCQTRLTRQTGLSDQPVGPGGVVSNHDNKKTELTFTCCMLVSVGGRA